MPQHLLVVGGSRGLGRAFTAMAKASGANVSVLSRTPSIPPEDGHYSCDISQADLIPGVLRRIHRERGDLHGLAFFQRCRAGGDSWEGELRTSLTGTKLMIEQAVPFFSLDDPKSIVLVSSVNATFISPRLSCGYHIAKAGICHLARYYAWQLGERGIRVNAVCPGTFVKPETEPYYRANPAVAQRFAAASPLNRMGTYADVANVIFFLLSDKSSFITGQSLVVDGGVSLRWQEHHDS